MKKTKKLKKKSQKKLQILIITLLVLAGGILYVRMRLPQAQPLQIAEVGTSSPAVVELSTSPSTATLSPGSSTSVDIMMDTHGALVSGAVVEMAYDQSAISNITVQQGDFLAVTLSKPKVANGKVSFIFAAPPESGGKEGAGKVATLTLTAKTNANTSLSFTNNSIVAAIGFDRNMLKSAIGTTFAASQDTSTEPPVLVSNGAPADPYATLGTPTPAQRGTNTQETAGRVAIETPGEGRGPRDLAPVNFGNRAGTAMNPETNSFEQGSENRSIVARFVLWINSLFRRNQ